MSYQDIKHKNEDIIKLIIDSIGETKKFSQEDIRSFATAVINDATAAGYLGLQIDNQTEIFRLLTRKIKAANTAMINLYAETGRSSDGRYFDSMASNRIYKKLGVEPRAEIFIAYLSELNAVMELHRPAKRKPGKKSSPSLSLAKLIATQYYKNFGVYPAYSNSDVNDLGSTPFIRICLLMDKLFKIKITPHTQELAVNYIKNNY